MFELHATRHAYETMRKSWNKNQQTDLLIENCYCPVLSQENFANAQTFVLHLLYGANHLGEHEKVYHRESMQLSSSVTQKA